jgi:hypothetical protein
LCVGWRRPELLADHLSQLWSLCEPPAQSTQKPVISLASLGPRRRLGRLGYRWCRGQPEPDKNAKGFVGHAYVAFKTLKIATDPRSSDTNRPGDGPSQKRNGFRFQKKFPKKTPGHRLRADHPVYFAAAQKSRKAAQNWRRHRRAADGDRIFRQKNFGSPNNRNSADVRPRPGLFSRASGAFLQHANQRNANGSGLNREWCYAERGAGVRPRHFGMKESRL